MKNNLFVLPEKPLLEGKNHFVQLLFLLFFLLLGVICFSSLGQLVSMWIWGSEIVEHPTAGEYRLLQVFIAVGSFGMPALLFSYARHHRWFTYSRADTLVNDSVKLLYVGLLSFFLIPVVGIIATLNGMIPLPQFGGESAARMVEMEKESNEVMETILADTGMGCLLLNILVCAILPAVCEELFFRGTLQQLLTHWFKKRHLAIWVTAFVFSAIHLQFSGFFARMLLGAYLGYLLVWSGSLWLPVLAHLLHNTLSIVFQYVITVLELPVSENPPLLSQIPFALTCTILSVVLLVMLYRRREVKITESIDE